MHSRVAAVKAPRTHNRRRVTGSSGGRREGRESGQQRPNMSRRVFYSAVLLFLLFVMIGCKTGGAAKTDKGLKSREGSQPGNTFGWRDVEKEKVYWLYFPSIVEMNGEVFAVTQAQCQKESKCLFTGIASEALTLSDPNPKFLDKAKLKTQVLEKRPFEEGKCPIQSATPSGSQSLMRVIVRRPTTVVNGSDIYMLAGNYIDKIFTTNEDSEDEDDEDPWGLLLVKGDVIGGDTDKRIYWNNTLGIPWTLFNQHRGYLENFIGSGGSGVRMNDGTLLFPVEAMKEDEEEGIRKPVSLVIHSSNVITNWTVSRGMSAVGCSDPSVVEWKDKLMMMTACDDGRRRVYESADKGESWTEALGTLSRVWGNKKDGLAKDIVSGFITATIEETKVMLVTLPVYSKAEDEYNAKGKLHLWLTDNTHIVGIGSVSGEEDVAASSLLYKSGGSGTDGKKEELIALYEKRMGGEEQQELGIISVLLTDELQRVKDVLATWKEVDKRFPELCSSSAAQVTSAETACTADKITAGLVGFLSCSFSDGTWRDEYLGVNARVTSGVGTENGVTFTGPGAWAEWPVGGQEQNQLYHFANYNFTLVATVSIHKVPGGDTLISLIGVKMNGTESTVLLGVSYNKEKQWQALCGGKTTTEHSSGWEPETTHQVAIVLQNGTQGSVYVDGQRVGTSCELNVTEPQEISHFYIGGDGSSTGREEDVPVTVTNVLLYNRPLNDDEITALNAIKVPILKLTDPKRVTATGATGRSTALHGEADGGGGTDCVSGLLPLLLLLGPCVFAAL
ncbi:trans-sialidase, putative [Trypanosoma cruzi marinkellei]|uniref:Trans-sialidase, putative n=1 Tax=Trypanosoma cruzi marinkellei TaxID=85056 RepID=K2MP77_TRYCR|nr:trans-sialidase, putative [Trypanosoma cruzi marinkellei]